MSDTTTADSSQSEYRRLALRTLVIVSIVAAVFILAVTAWIAIDVLLMVFAAYLLSVMMRGIGNAVGRHTFIPRNLASGLSLLVILGLLVFVFWLLSPNIADQFDQLSTQIAESARHLEHLLRNNTLGQRLLDAIPAIDQLVHGGAFLTRARGVISTTSGLVIGVIVVVAVGVYSAVQPNIYRDGILQLIPPRGRRRAHEVLSEVDNTMLRWLVGQSISMSVVGILTGLGLWFLGIPLAFTLGLIAALLEFVPNFGPVIAAVPALLVGFAHSPATGFHVLLLYVGVQFLESYLITPQVQHRAVFIPPALHISTQIVFGTLLGMLGLLLATPIVACCMVVVRMLYVDDTLGDGENSDEAGNADRGENPGDPANSDEGGTAGDGENAGAEKSPRQDDPSGR